MRACVATPVVPNTQPAEKPTGVQGVNPRERNKAWARLLARIYELDPITLLSLGGTSDMTHCGHMKTINISTLKARLSAELKEVRRGGRLVVMDRETPIPSLGLDPLEALLADRQAR